MSSKLKDILMTAENKKPKKTLSFNKFFPKDNAFINVSGALKDAEDWWVELTMQTGPREAITLWASEWKPEDQIKQLKALIEGAQKAISFAEDCVAMPKQKTTAKKK